MDEDEIMSDDLMKFYADSMNVSLGLLDPIWMITNGQ